MRCPKCNGPTVTRALFTSSYQHCDRCEGKGKEEPKALADKHLDWAEVWAHPTDVDDGATTGNWVLFDSSFTSQNGVVFVRCWVSTSVVEKARYVAPVIGGVNACPGRYFEVRPRTPLKRAVTG